MATSAVAITARGSRGGVQLSPSAVGAVARTTRRAAKATNIDRTKRL
jgi:hypothetical protein